MCKSLTDNFYLLFSYSFYLGFSWPNKIDGGEGGGGGADGEVCILRSPGMAAFPISLLFMGGVCGRSLRGLLQFLGKNFIIEDRYLKVSI